jgi:hypothetical protein
VNHGSPVVLLPTLVEGKKKPPTRGRRMGIRKIEMGAKLPPVPLKELSTNAASY